MLLHRFARDPAPSGEASEQPLWEHCQAVGQASCVEQHDDGISAEAVSVARDMQVRLPLEKIAPGFREE
jgi:hypothetical protein